MRKVYFFTLFLTAALLMGAGCATMDENSGRWDSSERAVHKHMEREARKQEKLRKAAEKKAAKDKANAEKARKAARKKNPPAR